MGKGLSRRTFIAGVPAVSALGAAGYLFATSRRDLAAPPTLVPLFSSDRVIAAGIPQRIPFAVVDDGNTGDLADDDAVAVTVRRDAQAIADLTVRGRVVEHDHVGDKVDPTHQHAKVFRYYPLRAELPEPGIYDLEIKFGAATSTMPIQAFAPDDIQVLLPGEQMPRLKTASNADVQDVDTLCTRFEGTCPFHTASVAELLATGNAMAILVATPALCATAYCGPVLELLITAAPRYPSIEMVHIEPYANTAEVENNYADPNIRLAEAVTDLGLEFEPSLFLVNKGGLVVERIDNLFDTSELDGALSALI